MNIIHTSWIYIYFVDTICILCKYSFSVDIIRILWKYPRPVDISEFLGIIGIAHITSYLARNVRHGLHSFVLVVDIFYIDHITSYLATDVCSIFYI